MEKFDNTQPSVPMALAAGGIGDWLYFYLFFLFFYSLYKSFMIIFTNGAGYVLTYFVVGLLPFVSSFIRS